MLHQGGGFMPEECLERLPPAPWPLDFGCAVKAFDAWEVPGLATVRMSDLSLLDANLSSRRGRQAFAPCRMPAPQHRPSLSHGLRPVRMISRASCARGASYDSKDLKRSKKPLFLLRRSVRATIFAQHQAGFMLPARGSEARCYELYKLRESRERHAPGSQRREVLGAGPGVMSKP